MAHVVKKGIYGFEVIHEGAKCYIALGSRTWSLYCLETDKDCRGKGHASKVLSLVKRLARRARKEVRLGVGPYRDQPMNVEQLLKFYTKMGFQRMDNSLCMAYKP